MNQTAQVWKDQLSKADQSIYIETPYLSDSNNGELEEVYDIINNSVRTEGVKLKILTTDLDNNLDSLVAPNNAELIETSSLNTHNKYFVIDKEEVFVGSQNWAQTAVETNHELGFYTKNESIAKTYTKLFNDGWESAGGTTMGGIQ